MMGVSCSGYDCLLACDLCFRSDSIASRSRKLEEEVELLRQAMNDQPQKQ